MIKKSSYDTILGRNLLFDTTSPVQPREMLISALGAEIFKFETTLGLNFEFTLSWARTEGDVCCAGGRPPTWSPPDQTRRAAVGRNELHSSFLEGPSKYELILRRFRDFLEFLHFHHRDPPRGESVQLLSVANILSCAIIF